MPRELLQAPRRSISWCSLIGSWRRHPRGAGCGSGSVALGVRLRTPAQGVEQLGSGGRPRSSTVPRSASGARCRPQDRDMGLARQGRRECGQAHEGHRPGPLPAVLPGLAKPMGWADITDAVSHTRAGRAPDRYTGDNALLASHPGRAHHHPFEEPASPGSPSRRSRAHERHRPRRCPVSYREIAHLIPAWRMFNVAT